MRSPEQTTPSLESSPDLPTFLQNEQMWDEEVARRWEKYRNRLLFDRTLGDKQWERTVDTALQPEDIASWSERERLAYLEALGRFAVGIHAFHPHYDFFRNLLFRETLQLAERLDTHRATATDTLLEIGVIYMEMERDTNMSGARYDDFERRMIAAAARYRAAGDTAAEQALFNPFHLAPGTELYRFDKATQSIITDTVSSILVDGKESLIMVGDHAEELSWFNKELVYGSGDGYTLRSGENSFGGVSTLRERIAPFAVGNTVHVNVRSPLSNVPEPEIVTIHITGSNEANLRTQYGDAFIPFIGRFPQHQPLFTVDLTFGNEQRTAWDVRLLKVVAWEPPQQPAP